MILQHVRDTLPEECTLAVFDHVSSNTAIRMPVEQLIQLCKERGVPAMIDGAHGPGQFPVNLDLMDPDYYVGNCHKWMGSPRGVGFLYTKRALQHEIVPSNSSHGAGHGYCSEFIWDGARDYGAALA